MDQTFQIRYTSDTHGYLFPTNYADSTPRQMGLLQLCPEFPHDGNTLILDGGDTIQGSPLTNFYYRLPAEERHAAQHPIAAVMNLAGYQYITLGNHDFNHGVDALNDYLTELDAICLCANICDTEHNLPIAPYAIHQLDCGLRIGLVGICTHYVQVWENPDTRAHLIIKDAFETAKEVYNEIHDQCDFTILLYHGGYERDLTTGVLLSSTSENQACRICDEIGYDLVLTGHQHIAQSGTHFGKSYTVQPPQRGAGACSITVTLHQGSPAFASEIIPAQFPAPSEALNLLSPLEQRVQNWLDTPAGCLSQDLPAEDHLYTALHGSLIANFINTVQHSVSGAMVSTTALPNDYKGFSRNVTIRDIVSTYIYTNTMLVLSVSPETLKSYMEHTAEYFTMDTDGSIHISDLFMRPKVQHYNYDYFSGIDYTIDVSQPVGSRIVSMSIDGKPASSYESISLCINSYRFSGTGGYSMLPGQPILQDIQTDIADAIIEYILSRGNVEIDTHRYISILPPQAD